MGNVGYQVTALRAVCVDFDDGRSVSLQPGTCFEASPKNPQVARLLRNNGLRELGPNEPKAPPLTIGFSEAVTSLQQARADRIDFDKTKVVKPAPAPTAPIKKGDLVERPTKNKQ